MEKARVVAAQWQKEAESDWGMDCTYVANETNAQKAKTQDRLNFERAGCFWLFVCNGHSTQHEVGIGLFDGVF